MQQSDGGPGPEPLGSSLVRMAIFMIDCAFRLIRSLICSQGNMAIERGSTGRAPNREICQTGGGLGAEPPC